MNHRLLGTVFLCTTLLLSACSKHSEPSTAITGKLSYSTPQQFSGKPRLELQLTDVSVTGPALEVAATTVTDITQLPYVYRLPYDAARIDSAHRYTVAARLYINDELKYATDSAIEVLTQGKGNYADIDVIATGSNETSATVAPTGAELFQGELHSGNEVTLYRAGVTDGHIIWLEEDRSNGTPQPTHGRYEFKGALLTHYVDSSPMEIMFDETGRPTGIVRNNHMLVVAQEMNAINAARNRAALLRAHALATRESQAHRKATKNDVN